MLQKTLVTLGNIGAWLSAGRAFQSLWLLGILAVVLAACGSQPSPGGGGGTNGARSFAGELQDGSALIALVIDNGQALAYVCGKDETLENHTGYFSSTAISGVISPATSLSGLKLAASFSDTQASGNLTLKDGTVIAFQANRADPSKAAGLFQLADSDGITGLIITNEQKVAGNTYFVNGDGTASSSPVVLNSSLSGPLSSVSVSVGVPGLPSDQSVKTQVTSSKTLPNLQLIPQTGTLNISVSGLDSGLAARVKVSGPSFSTPKEINAQGVTVLQVLPGNYTLTAENVSASATRLFEPTVSQPQPVVVSRGTLSSSSVIYTANTRGTLKVEIVGLPSGVSGAVRVRNDTALGNNTTFDRTLTQTTTLSVAAGAYLVTASDVIVGSGANAVVHRPSPNIRHKFVSAGENDQALVTYNVLETGKLDVRINGLPLGVLGRVAISGPENFTVFNTRVVDGLKPGTYNAVARAVFASGGRIFRATATPASTILGSIDTDTFTANYALQKGTLELSISGLPSGVNASVRITGPNSFDQTFTASKTLNLEPGTYQMSAAPISANGKNFTAAPASETFTISSENTTGVQVEYSEFTRLAVFARGLPAGVATNISVSGPNGFSDTIQDSTGIIRFKIYNNPAPGTYTITANDVSANGTTFRAVSPKTRTINVVSGQNFSTTFDYRTLGVLDVSINGLPAGLAGNVTIGGPANFSANLSSSQLIKNLEPGTYTASAQSISTVASGVTKTFVPSVSPASTVLSLGDTDSFEINYALQLGSVQIVIQGLPSGVEGEVRLTGPSFPNGLTIPASSTRNVVPGSYSVVAGEVSGPNNKRFGVSSISGNPASVSSGQTKTITVVYGALN